jgi:hypothetical protein
MKKLKLIVLTGLTMLFISSCDQDDDTLLTPDRSRYIPNYDFALTNTQQIPANTSTASGRIEGIYDKKTSTYTYKITWAGLSSAITGIHIHGLAGRGYVAIPGKFPAPAAIAQSASGYSTATSGTYSGSFFVDGTLVTETDLLADKFYVDIHTVNFPGGEIRGQLIFP